MDKHDSKNEGNLGKRPDFRPDGIHVPEQHDFKPGGKRPHERHFVPDRPMRTAVDAQARPQPEPKAEVDPDAPIKAFNKLYETTIINKTDRPIAFRNPVELVLSHSHIQPGQKLTLKFLDTSYQLMPYSRVIYQKRGRVDLVSRMGYKTPELAFPVCTFLSKKRKEEVIILAQNDTIKLTQGIPQTRRVPIESFYAEFTEVIVEKNRPVQRPSMHRPGQTEMTFVSDIRYVKRTKKELDKIKQLRERMYLASVGLG